MDTIETMDAALREAVEALGGPSAAAQSLDEKQSTVSMWLVRGRVSDRAALRLAQKSGVSVNRLRPDIFGVVAIEGKRVAA